MTELLFVCMANRARSPLAELTARALLAQVPGGHEVTVASAGTWTRGGEPMWGPAAAEAQARGLAVEAFRSRMLDDPIAREAKVVLAATRALRDEIVAARPWLFRRAFTWCELAWLFTAAPPQWQVPLAERVATIPTWAATVRGRVQAPAGDAYDVEDPAGRSPEVMQAVAARTVSAVERIVGTLAVPAPVAG